MWLFFEGLFAKGVLGGVIALTITDTFLVFLSHSNLLCKIISDGNPLEMSLSLRWWKYPRVIWREVGGTLERCKNIIISPAYGRLMKRRLKRIMGAVIFAAFTWWWVNHLGVDYIMMMTIVQWWWQYNEWKKILVYFALFYSRKYKPCLPRQQRSALLPNQLMWVDTFSGININ